MVTRQAIEPAVAANAPTATPAIEPDCTAKTLAIETGAAKQPSNQAIAPPCTAIALADPAIELEDIKEQIIAHVIERRDEIPCGADVELIAHAFAKELADDIFFIASSGTGTTVTEMIKSNVATVLSVSKLTLDLVKKEEAFAAISDHAPKPTPLVFVQLAVVSSLVGTGVATVLQVSAPEVAPEPTAAAHMTEDTQRTVRTRPVPSPCVPVDAATALAGAPSSSAGVPHGRPPGDIWAECDRAMNRTGALMMFGAGPTIANGGSDDDPDLLRIAEVMNEANLPSADLIMQMPTGVTYNEYIEYESCASPATRSPNSSRRAATVSTARSCGAATNRTPCTLFWWVRTSTRRYSSTTSLTLCLMTPHPLILPVLACSWVRPCERPCSVLTQRG